MGQSKFSIIAFFILVLFAWALFAQDVNIKATVSQNQVALDGQFQYSVEVSGSSTSLPSVTFPDFTDFYVLSGPNTSTSIQWVNGAMTSSKTYSFYLRPRKEGKLKIGIASLTYKGKTLHTDEITITVKKGAAGTIQQRTGKAPKKTRDPDIAGENLYLKTKVSKRNIFLGEQIIVEYRLYFKVNVRGYNFDKIPANAGFWSEDFKMPSQPSVENEVVNGINYNVATLRKVALFPTQSGELIIEPLQVTLEAVVRSPRRRKSLFDSFFDDPFGRTVQKTISSKPVTINIKPLPFENKPSGFKGAVGNYKFDVSVDKNRAELNEAISLKINLLGTGNIKLLDLPEVQIPPDIEQYEPKITSKVNNDGKYISGSKSAEYILVPRIVGEYKIKPITFSYFNPVKKEYSTVSSGQISLNIIPGSGKQLTLSPQTGSYSRHEVALLGKDIRFIKEYSYFNTIGFLPYLASNFWITIFAGIFLFVVFVIYNDHQARLLGNVQLARSKKAGKIAARQLSTAKKQINAENQSDFYKAISLALQGFVQDKLNIELTDFSTSNVSKVLKERRIAAEEMSEYLAILEESDFRQYANISASLNERKDFLDKAKSILTKLEKWI